MKTDKNNKPVTQEEIDRVLAALDVTELNRLALEKKYASLQPMIDEFTQTEKRLVELRKSIREVNPDWAPPTLAGPNSGIHQIQREGPRWRRLLRNSPVRPRRFLSKR